MSGAAGSVMPGRAVAGMHAFLFADLRGYTRFAATRGDQAAAELLARYRSLVRAEVDRHDGAEIRTEGDSFYVVFPSVSAAVRCALAIAATARETTAQDPSHPIDVGIGVHFGETVDTAEGSVGSAVNLAARIASAAGPNEVLVSEVVRSLTTNLPDVRAASLGARRLKGFADPVPVYRAVSADATPIVRRRRLATPVSLLGGAAAALAVIVLVAWVAVGGLGTPAPTATGSPIAGSASPSPTAVGERAFVLGFMEPGAYINRDFIPNVRLELQDDWCGGFSRVGHFAPFPGPDVFYVYSPGTSNPLADLAGDPCTTQSDPDAGFFSLNRVDQVYGPTACDDGATRSLGRSRDDLLEYLTTLPGTSVSNRSSAPLGGVVGVAVDLHVDQGTVCLRSGAPTRAVLAFPMTIMDQAGGPARVAPVWWAEGQYVRLWVVEVDGQLVVATLGRSGSQEPISRVFSDKAYQLIRALEFVLAS